MPVPKGVRDEESRPRSARSPSCRRSPCCCCGRSRRTPGWSTSATCPRRSPSPRPAGRSRRPASSEAHLGEPAPARDRLRAGRRARHPARHRHGPEPLGAGGARSAGRGALSDPEGGDPAAADAGVRPGRRLEGRRRGNVGPLSDHHQHHGRRGAARQDLFRRRAQLRHAVVQAVPRVILPGALPTIFAGLRISLGVSLVVLVSAEFVAVQLRHRLPDLELVADADGREHVRRHHRDHDPRRAFDLFAARMREAFGAVAPGIGVGFMRRLLLAMLIGLSGRPGIRAAGQDRRSRHRGRRAVLHRHREGLFQGRQVSRSSSSASSRPRRRRRRSRPTRCRSWAAA